MSEITRRPPRLSASLATVLATVSLLAVGTTGSTALAAGVAGLPLLGVGAFRGSRRAITYGAVLLVAGTLLGGVAGAGPEALLVGLVAAVVAWDVGHFGVGVGEQLGREARTGRLESVHFAGSLAVGAVTAGLGYAVFLAAGGGQPLVALVFLLVGGVFLVYALRR
ncbi:MAG: hypothetical protein ABEJ79_11620 [Halolamina sp.]